MTREEAIQILADLTDNPFLHTWEEQYKALHMAIEALKGGDADMTVIPEGTGLMKPCPDNGADLISRELAMERIANDNVTGGMERINEYNNSTEFNDYLDGISDAITTIFCDVPSAEAEPKMTEEVREALMRLTMCAREECGMCKYKDECGFEFQYNISTENMHTILDALSAEAVQGEWVRKYDDKVNCYWYECDQCGEYRPRNQFGHEYNANFCPNCGAKMSKGGGSE